MPLSNLQVHYFVPYLCCWERKLCYCYITVYLYFKIKDTKDRKNWVSHVRRSKTCIQMVVGNISWNLTLVWFSNDSQSVLLKLKPLLTYSISKWWPHFYAVCCILIHHWINPKMFTDPLAVSLVTSEWHIFIDKVYLRHIRIYSACVQFHLKLSTPSCRQVGSC